MSIRRIIDKIIEVEGGYVDHPSDRGGPTRYGITEAVARQWGYQGAMRDLPRDLAFRIYMHDYVEAPGFDRVNEISPAIAEELVDTGVNMGAEGRDLPSVWLQEWLNVFNRQERDYADIKTDGDIGPATLGALQAFLNVRGDEGEVVMLTALNSSQGERYKVLSLAREKNEDFTYGWLRARVRV